MRIAERCVVRMEITARRGVFGDGEVIYAVHRFRRIRGNRDIAGLTLTLDNRSESCRPTHKAV